LGASIDSRKEILGEERRRGEQIKLRERVEQRTQKRKNTVQD